MLAGEPLPPRNVPFASARSAARAEAIRRLFVDERRGFATVDEVIAAAKAAGLLEGVRSPKAMRNIVCAALSVIARPNDCPRVSTGSPGGQQGVRPGLRPG